MRRAILTALAGCVMAVTASAAEPQTVMTERGKMILSDDFAKGLGDGWKTGKGKWEGSDGALKGVEVKDDMHAAVVRRDAAFRAGVIEYAFRLDGGKVTTLSLNGAKGHICRVLIKPTGITVQKDDQDGKNGPDKPAPLDTAAVEIKPGEWHTLVVELSGKEMLARLDGKHVALGSHDAIDADKTNIGLTVSGEGVSFKNLKVFEATPTKNWEATRTKLLEERKAAATPK